MPPPQPNAMGLALMWVSRITVVGLEMVLPGLAGQWLDDRYGTRFLGPCGFVFGLIAGMWHLIVMTRPTSRPGKPGQDELSS